MVDLPVALRRVAELERRLVRLRELLLAERGVLEGELASRLGSAVRMRNLLVHRYAEVDQGRVFDTVVADLGDLEAAAAAMVRFVESTGSEE